MASELVLVGGGGHALVVAESAALAGFRLQGFYDDDPGAAVSRRLCLPHLGALAEARSARSPLIVALGDLVTRQRALSGLGAAARRAASVINPAALVSGSATVGPGVFVAPRAVVHSFAVLGAHCIINTGAIVEHECEVGQNSHIAPGAVLGGTVVVGRSTLVGLGARVLPGIRIGDSCVIGAGAVVTRDVPEGSTVVGVPAAALQPARH